MRPDLGREPTLQFIWVVATNEHVIRNVVILRAGPLVVHTAPNVFKPAVLQREAARSGNVLDSEQERNIPVLQIVSPSK